MSASPVLSMIVAKSRNNVIGRDGDLPWRLTGDLQHFKRTTLGKPVLMGRKTFESLGRPLPGRSNLVLSRDREYRAKGAENLHTLPDLIGRGYEIAGETGANEVMIIGGAMLYRACLRYAQRLYLSNVDVDIDGDAYFPKLDLENWLEISKTDFPKDDKNDYAYSVLRYDRVLGE